METETETRWALLPTDEFSDPEHVGLLHQSGPSGEDVTRADLQAIVQAAYDQHGICADPFASPRDWRAELPTLGELLETEPSEPGRCRCPWPESCSDTAHRGGRAASHAMAMAHNAGVRA